MRLVSEAYWYDDLFDARSGWAVGIEPDRCRNGYYSCVYTWNDSSNLPTTQAFRPSGWIPTVHLIFLPGPNNLSSFESVAARQHHIYTDKRIVLSVFYN
jgi:hypothetical protein